MKPVEGRDRRYRLDGWPYIGVRLYNNLYFDARAAWGTSENDIWLSEDAGKRRGDFDTDRWLASARLTGNQYYGPWRFSPQVQIAYGNESSDRFTNSLDQLVSGQDATIGRLTGTAEVGYRIAANGMIVEPYASLAGIWNFDTEDDLFVDGVAFGLDESRGKVEGGIIFSTPRGWAFRAAGAYDERCRQVQIARSPTHWRKPLWLNPASCSRRRRWASPYLESFYSLSSLDSSNI